MTEEKKAVAVLLAAGSGSRFGGDKLLHCLADGVPIAAHAARNLKTAGLAVTAVVRPHDGKLKTLLEAEGCAIVVCPDAAAGMGHSLAEGVRATAGASGWVVALADMPAIQPMTIRTLVQALAEGASIAAPRYLGERGHPVAFAAHHYADLAALTGDAGARYLMQAQRGAVKLFDVADPGVVYDIDLPSHVRPPV